MLREFFNAFMGKLQWGKLCKKHPAERYIFMPHRHDEYNDYALQYLHAYMDKEKIHSVCLITCDDSIYNAIRDMSMSAKYEMHALLKSEKWLRKIIRFYALYEFSNKIKIISLTEPYDTCGENLLGVHGITKRELLCYDIYGFATIPGEGETAP